MRTCGSMQCLSYRSNISGTSYSTDEMEPILASLKLTTEGQLTSKNIEELNLIIEGLQLKKLQTWITPGQPLSKKHSTDQASYEITILKGQFPKMLIIYLGCHSIPRQYTELPKWLNTHWKSNSLG